jgi:hypothetical protein
MDNTVKFIADVKHVKEVILVCDADLAFWREQLKPTGLFPYNCDGKAEIQISATDLRWMVSHTNEFTVSIVVSETAQAHTQDGSYLIYAFNSSGLFAFIERTFFNTPYYPAYIQIDEKVPAHIQLSESSSLIFNAQMGRSLDPARSQSEMWQGKIFLPNSKGAISTKHRYFIARLGGDTQAFTYSASTDTLEITPSKKHPVFDWLLDSNLTGKEWRLRQDATHSRSATFIQK